MVRASRAGERRSYCVPYTAQEQMRPFVFVSYAHADKAKVKPVVDALYRQGFRIWYDEEGAGIPAGFKWEDWIFNRLEASSAFLGFVSQHNEHRLVVLKEIQAALNKREAAKNANEDYPVLFVCLEKVSTRSFPRPEDLAQDGLSAVGRTDTEPFEVFREHLSSCQFVNYKNLGGLTDKLMNVLINQNWPEGLIDNEWRKSVGKPILRPKPSERSEINEIDECLVGENDFADLAHFEWVEGSFDDESGSHPLHKTSPDRIDRNTAYATYLDNQWVPESMFASEDFKRDGVLARRVKAERSRRQRIEILRGLLNNWQIVVNRAAIWNSEVFLGWFKKNSADRSDFGELVATGAIVLFLMKEKGPAHRADFTINEEAYREWIEFCKEYPATFLRFDWEDDNSNDYECSEHISRAFQDFCLTMASNRDRIDAFADALDIPEAERDDFASCWAAVRADVVAWSEKQRRRIDGQRQDYTRERFCQEFLIKDKREGGTRASVNEGILDWDGKPFVGELKRVVDFLYVMNLPLALQVHPLLPVDSKLRPFLLTGGASSQLRREIEKDELVYALGEFEPVLEGKNFILDGSHPSLAEIRKLRELNSWRAYLSALAESKDRTRLDQVDFYDALRVWERRRDFIEEVAGLDELSSLHWKKSEGALTLLLRFEGFELRVVYREGGTISYDYSPKDWKDLPSLNRKTDLSIGFACCDAADDEWHEDPFVAESRIFDGITHKRGVEIVGAVLEMLNYMTSQTQSQDCNVAGQNWTRN